MQSHLTPVNPTFSWNQPEGSVKSYDLELEAVGVPDHRVIPGVRTYENFTSEDPAVKSYTDQFPRQTPTPTTRRRRRDEEHDLTYPLPAEQKLLPGQLYRWRATSNSFFSKSETSEWQYFVTEGPQRLSVGDASVVEGTSSSRSARFTVSLSAPMTQDVYFKYATVPGTAMPVDTPLGPADFTHTTGTGVIDAGSTSTSVSVPIKGDSVVEGPEIFYLGISPISPVAALKPFGAGTIIADDPSRGAGISVGDASVVEGKAGDRFLRFTVSRHSRKADPVTVSYITGPGTATAGSDFTAGSGTVTINANETSAVIRVPVQGDTARESAETMWVWLTSPTGGAVFRPVGFGTILDDD